MVPTHSASEHTTDFWLKIQTADQRFNPFLKQESKFSNSQDKKKDRGFRRLASNKDNLNILIADMKEDKSKMKGSQKEEKREDDIFEGLAEEIQQLNEKGYYSDSHVKYLDNQNFKK